MPLPITLDQPITFDSLLCKDTCINLESADGNFCFQLPMFADTGTNLLSITEVDLTEDFTNSTTYNNPVDDNGSPTACGAPFTRNDNPNGSPPTAANVIAGVGKRFHEVTLSTVTIDYGINNDDDTVGKLQLGPQTSQRAAYNGDNYDFTEADANSSLFWLGDLSWDAGAATVMEMYIIAKSECDDTNEHIKHDITMTEYSVYPAFLNTTFTAANDTFYRLQFTMDKTSSLTVEVEDSSGTAIIEETFTGPVYDKIFKTGTLPSSTVTVKWRFNDLTEWPNANFNLDVLTSVSVTKMCKWDMDIKDSAGNLLSGSGINIVETHDTTTLDVDGVSYNDNIQYCIDLSLLTADDYRFVATDGCDAYTEYDSAQFKICDADCSYYSKISWDHGNVKFIGANKLDYFNYTYVPFFRVRVDLQDLTQQLESTFYQDAAGYLQQPYTYYRNVQVMQISEVPGYMRRAIALALTDVFSIDGVQYRKLDDEDIAPLFQATDPNAVRVLVTKVGDFTESKNV